MCPYCMLERILGICYLGPQVVLCPIFSRTTKLISKVVVWTCNDPSNVGVILFLFILAEFLILAILNGVRWNLRLDLICISLMTKDFEHFFRCFSAIQFSSVENSLFISVPHFLIGLLGSLESNFFISCIYGILALYWM